MKKLVIVESPTKAKTIAKFLGKDYKIMSSYGHLRDLPTRELGVDVEHNFLPKYVVAKDKKVLVTELKKAAAKAEMVYFATDEDREGEAISWHLLSLLSNSKKKLPHERIVFHEITKPAILRALEKPRELDQNLIDAQQARRVLDRLVGYKLSPFLWSKVAKGLSAGRVQSVAVRLIVEREREIQSFKTEEYWALEAELKKEEQKSANKEQKSFVARLIAINEQKIDKLDIKNKEQMDQILTDLADAEYRVAKVERKETSKNPPAPFTTSSLQQEAYNKLGFSAKQTMYLAQELYEGLKLGREQVGLITYMRTDSLNLAESFLSEARDYLKNNLGDKFLPASSRRFKTKSKLAQEAHEAIRPTDINRRPEDVKNFVEAKQFKMYDLIWRRSLASQMKEAIIDNTAVDVAVKKYIFRANGAVIKFPGFLKIYGTSKEDLLPELKQDELLALIKLDAKQKFTEPPARYNDASLVKKLEELGIGRPSTYAPIIHTITARNYIKREQGKFLPQEIALLVTDLLLEHFPDIIDYQFTADMENELDNVAAGKKEWVPVIREFYKPFNQNLMQKYNEIKKSDLVNETSDEICEKCGKPMAVKTSRYGKFLACTGFPTCRNTKKINYEGEHNNEAKDGAPQEVTAAEPEMTDIKCEKCGAKLLIRQGRFGKFYACSAFPKCKNTKALDQDTGVECPQCGQGKIVAKKTRARKTFYACDQYPKCKFALWSRPTGEKCPTCGSLMVNAGNNESKCSNKECGKK